MGTPLFITVSGAPVPKGRPRIGKGAGGRPQAFTPKKTRDYEAQVQLAAKLTMAGRKPLAGPLNVWVIAHLPIPKSWSKKKRIGAEAGQVLPTKRPDVDNFVKAALDGLNAIVFADDSQVVRVTACKAYSAKPRLEITVHLADGEAA